MILPAPLSHVFPKFFFFLFLKHATYQYNILTFAVFVIFFACVLPFVSSLLCSPSCFFSGSYFLCPSTFSFVLFLFPLSPFSPSHIPPPIEESFVSLFLNSISTVPPLLLFSYIPLLLLSLPFFLFCDGS
jgi:hypothetical protein